MGLVMAICGGAPASVSEGISSEIGLLPASRRRSGKFLHRNSIIQFLFKRDEFVASAAQDCAVPLRVHIPNMALPVSRFQGQFIVINDLIEFAPINEFRSVNHIKLTFNRVLFDLNP